MSSLCPSTYVTRSTSIDTSVSSINTQQTYDSDASPTSSYTTSSHAGLEDSPLPQTTMLVAVEQRLHLDDKQDVNHVEDSLSTSSHSGVTRAQHTSASNGAREDSSLDPSVENTIMHKPRRKFAPEPVETSTRSSQSKEATDSTPATPPKRKFAPEPVELTVRSSKNKEGSDAKPRRKFPVEPIESTTKSSKDQSEGAGAAEKDAVPKRRFAPEPVESSARSSKDKDKDKLSKPRRKFAVEPVETSAGSSKDRKLELNSGDAPKKPVRSDSDPSSVSRSSTGSSSRKFTPELVETARGSFRKHQQPASAVPKWLQSEIDEAENDSTEDPNESRFSAAALAKRSRADFRRHSYTVPDLPPIQSDSSGEESETSVPPTIAEYPSDDETFRQRKLGHVHNHKHNHVLSNHVKAVHMSKGLGMGLLDDKTLREQALQAFIADTAHVPVNHFAAEDEGTDSHSFSSRNGRLELEKGANPQLFRRMSHEDFHLVTEDMRSVHHDQLEACKRELEEDTAGASRFSAAALAARHHLGIHHPAAAAEAAQAHREAQVEEHEKRQQVQDEEYKRMRAAASPPMAGDGLNFPFSASPKMTRCDVDQVPRPRRANSDVEEDHDIGHEKLWSVHISVKQDASVGLWGGMCQKDDGNTRSRPTTPLRSGLQTPAFDKSNPFDTSTPSRRGARTPSRRPEPWTGMSFMPMTPPRSVDGVLNSHDPFTSHIDEKLQLEQQIAEEFPNRVITQIYNYLSLGYPPLARPFDEELSKISRIPIADLRRADRSDSGNVKGYIGTPEGEGDGVEDEMESVKCKRWEALRLYVFEWARQSPGFAESRKALGTDGWGTNAPVRKGSWAH